MKNILVFVFVFLLIQACSPNESIFVLSPSQSMSITGKGPGQDAAFNPYSEVKSLALVKNLGKNSFNVRVQNQGKIVENITIQPEGKHEVLLLKGYELYLDSELESKAHVDFKRY